VVKLLYLDTGTGSNKRNKTLEKPLSLLLQQLKTTIIFQKDMQYLQMLIIFMHEQQYHFGTQMKEFPQQTCLLYAI
jgi:hypothetical protein